LQGMEWADRGGLDLQPPVQAAVDVHDPARLMGRGEGA
jgi:hypothetical protein